MTFSRMVSNMGTCSQHESTLAASRKFCFHRVPLIFKLKGIKNNETWLRNVIKKEGL